ncbi:MAG: AsmA family protein [Candidatus Omnitrophota bacterium]
MKILKITIISILILVLLLFLAAAIFLKAFDINRFKPQIISQAQILLNRNVNFQRLSLGFSFTHGIGLKVKGLVIADDPAFQKGDFLFVEEISVGVDILGYLLRRKIDVSSIVIDSPRVTIIRNKDGSINAATIGPAPAAQGASKKELAVKPAAQAVPAALFVSALRVKDARVTYIDRSFEPAVSTEISSLDLSVKKISFADSFPFQAEAAIFSSKQNIRIEGKVKIDLQSGQASILGLNASTDLSMLELNKISSSLPMINPDLLPLLIKGRVRVSIPSLTIGSKGLSGLEAAAYLTDGYIQLRQVASAVSGLSAGVKVNAGDVLLDKASASLAGGVINISGKIRDYAGEQGFDFKARGESLKLQQLIRQDNSAIKIEGLLGLKVDLEGEGFSRAALESNLSGSGNIALSNAKLKNINILRTVLDKISIIPGLEEKIEESLSGSFKEKLTQTDTELSDADIPFVISGNRAIIKEITLGADEFLFRGEGEAGFDGSFSLKGAFLIPQELSAAMVSVVQQLEYLLNDDNQIYIPIGVSGKAPALKISVDAEYIAKKILAHQAKSQLFRVLDKAIGGAGGEGQDAGDAKDSIKEAVGSLLDKIFGN